MAFFTLFASSWKNKKKGGEVEKRTGHRELLHLRGRRRQKERKKKKILSLPFGNILFTTSIFLVPKHKRYFYCFTFIFFFVDDFRTIPRVFTSIRYNRKSGAKPSSPHSKAQKKKNNGKGKCNFGFVDFVILPAEDEVIFPPFPFSLLTRKKENETIV